jgi:hypothetical protein
MVQPPYSECPIDTYLEVIHTVRTVAADLRRGEHIPKMQNNIGRKSMLRVLRQLRSKEGGGPGAVPCRATPRSARPGAAFSTTAVNLRRIEFGEFGSGITKNTRRARSTFLQDCNPILYHLRHTFLVKNSVLNTRFPILVYYTIPYYTILQRLPPKLISINCCRATAHPEQNPAH